MIPRRALLVIGPAKAKRMAAVHPLIRAAAGDGSPYQRVV